MEAQQWLAELRAQLCQRRLPPLYVERIVDEMSDHSIDYQEDRMRKDATDLSVFPGDVLGAPDAVAAQAAKEYRSQSFAGRHPIWSFVALPIALLPAMWFVAGFVLLAAAKLSEPIHPWIQESQARLIGACIASWAWIFVLPACMTAMLLCRWARRARLDWRWLLATCVCLTVVSSLIVIRIEPWVNDVPGTGRFLIGVIPWTHTVSWYQCVQTFAPLLVGIYYLRRGFTTPLALPGADDASNWMGTAA